MPEMLIAAPGMTEASAILEPLLVGAGIEPSATAVIGSVKDDLHDIDKNLVAMMWKGANIAVVDLGTNVPPEVFVQAAQEPQAQIVGLGALLTTTMGGLRDVVAAVREAGLPAKVIAGGPPVTADFARQIGADGCASDAGSAAEVVLALLREQRRVLGEFLRRLIA